MNHRITLLPLAAVALLGMIVPPASAEGSHWWTPKIRAKETADGAVVAQANPPASPAPQPQAPHEGPPPPAAPSTDQQAKADQKAKADQQAKIDQQNKADHQAKAAAQAPPAAPASSSPASGAPAAATVAATAAVATAAAKPAEKAPPVPPPPPHPDETLKKTIVHMRQTPLATDPNVKAYLDRIEAGQGSPAQVNDFATYLAKKGMPRVGAQFQDYAVKLKPNDATLWLNLGTIRRSAGSLGGAETAYKKAIELDMGNALAHYNLGALYDAQKSYDAAIEEYRRALVLDMDLADPRKNPQVVNNEHLMAARLQIYQEQGGSMGLPLQQMQKPPQKPPAK